MWTRVDVKTKGKNAFKANYWTCVLVTLILSLISGSVGGGASSAGNGAGAGAGAGAGGILSALQGLSDANIVAVLALVFAIIGFALVVGSLVGIFLISPLEMGCDVFFLENTYEPGHIRTILSGFKNGYGNNVIALFLKSLFIGIGSLLFVIPGIYLGQCFRLVPYILADNPGISPMEALKESNRLMQGHKWAAFVLDLSFIGWYILSGLTLGILYILYVGPYIYSTNAVLYRTISNR